MNSTFLLNVFSRCAILFIESDQKKSAKQPFGRLAEDITMNGIYDVIVVGAGASGMTAAISAARCGRRTALLEHMECAGKKILSTGNGKCNFTNQVQGMECYRGQDPAFVLPVLKQFGLDETLDFFQEIGIWPKVKRGGYYYPASGQASSVRDALLLELLRLKVSVYYNIGIRSIHKQEDIFCFETKQGCFYSKVCIICTGGKAAKKTGSDGSGIPYIVGFGHKVSDFVPALVQLQGKQSFLKELAGIRAEVLLRLYANCTMVSKDRGEIQLTEFGVSGIPAFQVSRYGVYALLKDQPVHVTIDFAPDMEGEELKEFLWRQKRRNPQGRLFDALIGLWPGKLTPVLLGEAKLSEKVRLKQCGEGEFEALIRQAKGLRIDIVGSKSFDAAQVCAGGVCTDQINPQTMESRLVPGLFFAGEVVDIDGMCGGYNLQWAWSSGWVAGQCGGSK